MTLEKCFQNIVYDFTVFAPDGKLVAPKSHLHGAWVDPPYACMILKLKPVSPDGGVEKESLLKCIFHKSGELTRTHVSGRQMLNVLGPPEHVKCISSDESEIILVSERVCTMGDILSGEPLKHRVDAPSMGLRQDNATAQAGDALATCEQDLLYIGYRADEVLPDKMMWDLIVTEIRIIYSPSKDDCALQPRAMTIDNVCGTIACLAWSNLSPDLALHTIYGTVRFNYEQGIVNFRGVRDTGALVQKVVKKYAREGEDFKCNVNMMVLTVCTGRCHLVTRGGSLLETMLINRYTKRCIHVFSRSEMSGNLVKFSVRSWEAYSKSAQQGGFPGSYVENVKSIKDMGRVRNHVCTVSNSGFVMIRFFWNVSIPWSTELKEDVMAAANCLKDIVCACS